VRWLVSVVRWLVSVVRWLVPWCETAHKVKCAPHEADGALVLSGERLEVWAVVACEAESEARLAVGRVAPEAERDAMVAKVVVPREVVEEGVAQQSDELAAAAASCGEARRAIYGQRRGDAMID